MLIAKYTLETTASKVAIWNLWQDSKNWNTWDLSTEYCEVDGAFEEGVKGKWKAKNGPILDIKLCKVETLELLVWEFKLFLAHIVATHKLSQEAGKTHITQQIEIRGPLAFLYALHAGSSIKKNLPLEMSSMIKKAESSQDV